MEADIVTSQKRIEEEEEIDCTCREIPVILHQHNHTLAPSLSLPHPPPILHQTMFIQRHSVRQHFPPAETLLHSLDECCSSA